MRPVPTAGDLTAIPQLYSTEDVKAEEKMIHAHFFIGSCDWWVAQYDGHDLFFGFCCLGDPQNAEWGYVSFLGLKSVKAHGMFEVEFDRHWIPKPFREVWDSEKQEKVFGSRTTDQAKQGARCSSGMDAVVDRSG